MRRLIITAGTALALLASCGRPLTPPACQPTLVQPGRDAQISIIGRLADCDNLVVVSVDNYPVRLYVLPDRLNLSDDELRVLPTVQRGEG
jgi:hypothetical protein